MRETPFHGKSLLVFDGKSAFRSKSGRSGLEIAGQVFGAAMSEGSGTAVRRCRLVNVQVL